MATPTKALARDVIDDVRRACAESGRPTTDAEVRRSLEQLDAGEVERLRQSARAGFDARPLSPDALVDIVRGVAPAVAAARELGGYYTMKAERDYLAQIARTEAARGKKAAPAPEPEEDEPEDEPEEEEDEDSWEDPDDEAYDEDATEEDAPVDEDDDEAAFAAAAADAARDSRGGGGYDPDDDEVEPAPEPEEEEERPAPPDALANEKKVKRKSATALATPAARDEIQALITLFAYHRDAVRVAQELGIGMVELSDRIEELGLKRRIHRLLESTTDIDVFSPEAVSGPHVASNPAPVLRRRADKPERPAETEPVEIPAPPEETGPAARTTAVNAHGTRVYRRSPEPTPAPVSSALAGRREYVRESRRQRTRTAKPVVAPPPPKPAPPALRPFSELQSAGGAAVLERLLADEKANPRVLALKLGERFAGPADRPIAESDLRALLAHHGLAATFQEREIANTRFLIGFHQGARGKLTNALHLTPAELGPALARLGLDGELERTRGDRSRIELGKRRITDRIAQVLTRAPYLDDLGVLPVIDREVREHLESFFTLHGGRTPEALERARESLSLEPNAFNKLLRRYELA